MERFDRCIATCSRCTRSISRGVPLEGKFTGPDVFKAIESHVMAKAQLTGTYTLNPRLAKP